MPKTKQVAKIEANGKKFSIVYREWNGMPYIVYQHTWALRKCGYGYTERKRIYSYGEDLFSALRDVALEF